MPQIRNGPPRPARLPGLNKSLDEEDFTLQGEGVVNPATVLARPRSADVLGPDPYVPLPLIMKSTVGLRSQRKLVGLPSDLTRLKERQQPDLDERVENPEFTLSSMKADVSEFTLPPKKPLPSLSPGMIPALSHFIEPVSVLNLDVERPRQDSEQQEPDSNLMFRVPKVDGTQAISWQPSSKMMPQNVMLPAMPRYASTSVASKQGFDVSSIKTGEDAVQLFLSNERLPPEAPCIFYCNYTFAVNPSKRQLRHLPQLGPEKKEQSFRYEPYELTVVPRSSIYPEHFTVSATGVTHIHPGISSEVTPLKMWHRHRNIYNKLRTLGFFGKYVLSKAFKRWRQNVRSYLFSYARNYISVCLLQSTREFGAGLRRVAAIVDRINQNQTDEEWVRDKHGCWHLEKKEGWEHGLVSHGLATSLGYIGGDITVTVKDFCAARAAEVESVTAELARTVQVAQATVEEVTESATLEAHASLPQPLTKKQLRAQRFNLPEHQNQWRTESMYLAKLNRRDQRYQQRRGLWLLEMVGRFLRVADCMVVTQLLNLGDAAAREFTKGLQVVRRNGFFFVQGFIVAEEEEVKDAIELESRKALMERHSVQDGAVFEPSQAELCKVLENEVNTFVQVLGTIPRLITEPKFQPLWGDTPRPQHQGVAPILRDRINVDSLHGEARRVLVDSYEGLMQTENVTVFKDAGVMHAFSSSWSASEYQRRSPTADDFCTDLTTLRQWRKDLDKTRNQILQGMVYMDLTRLKAQLVPAATRALQGMTSLLQGAFARHCQLVGEALQQDTVWLKQKPLDLIEFANFVAEARPHLPGGSRSMLVEADQATTIKFCELLGNSGRAGDSLSYMVNQESLSEELMRVAMGSTSDAWVEMNGLFNYYFSAAHECNLWIQEATPVMVAALKKAARSIEEDLKSLLLSLRGGPVLDADMHPRDVLEHLEKAKEALSELREHVAEAKAHQELFKSPPLLDLETLEDNTGTLLQARIHLWQGLSEWEAFLQKVEETDVVYTQLIMWDEVDHEISMVDAAVMELEKLPTTTDSFVITHITFDEKEFVALLRERINRWKGYMPMLRKLCDPALQMHHWVALLQQLELHPSTSLSDPTRVSLAHLLRAGILEAPQLVDTIWEQAVEEARLLVQLNELDAFLESVQLQLKIPRDEKGHEKLGFSGTPYLSNLEDLLRLVHRNQAMLTAMTQSQFLLGIVERFEKLEASLRALELALETGKECQEVWQFLGTLLSPQRTAGGEEGRDNLRMEISRFETLHSIWARMLQQLVDQPPLRLLRRACASGGILCDAKDLLKSFLDIRKSCQEFLDLLRTNYPRFNFLGDPELLKVASGPGNPSLIDPDILHSMFPNVGIFVSECTHKGTRYQVMAWQGDCGEVVNFSQAMSSSNDQGIDMWLSALEEAMKTTMRTQSKTCLKTSATMLMNDWVTAYPRQCVLLADQIVWTDLVHGALHDLGVGNRAAIHGLYEQNVARVEFLSKYVQRLRMEREIEGFDIEAVDALITPGEGDGHPFSEASESEDIKDMTPLTSEKFDRVFQAAQAGPQDDSEKFHDDWYLKLMAQAGSRKRDVADGTYRELLLAAVMHREIVGEMMYETTINSESDYGWLRHLRYYWEPEVDQCSVAAGYTKLQYGFEYTGRGPLSIQTPCNTKDFLAAAASLGPGSVVTINGPERATSNLQIPQALAQACGRLMIPFFCAGLREYRVMERLVAGLVQCGGWCTLVDADTLAPALVSLLSNQLVEIYRTLASGGIDTTVKFQHYQIHPDPGFACFLAVTPSTPYCLTSLSEGEAGKQLQLSDAVRRVSRNIYIQALDPTVVVEAGLRCMGLSGAVRAARELIELLRMTQAHQTSKSTTAASVAFVPRSALAILNYITSLVDQFFKSNFAGLITQKELRQVMSLPSTTYALIAKSVHTVVAPTIEFLHSEPLQHLLRTSFGKDVKPTPTPQPQEEATPLTSSTERVINIVRETPTQAPTNPLIQALLDVHSSRLLYKDWVQEVQLGTSPTPDPTSLGGPTPLGPSPTPSHGVGSTALTAVGSGDTISRKNSAALSVSRKNSVDDPSVSRQLSTAMGTTPSPALGADSPDPSDGGVTLEDCLREVCRKEFPWSVVEEMTERCLSLWELMRSFSACVVLGAPGTGKTTAHRVLASALRLSQTRMQALASQNPAPLQPVLEEGGAASEPGSEHGQGGESAEAKEEEEDDGAVPSFPPGPTPPPVSAPRRVQQLYTGALSDEELLGDTVIRPGKPWTNGALAQLLTAGPDQMTDDPLHEEGQEQGKEQGGGEGWTGKKRKGSMPGAPDISLSNKLRETQWVVLDGPMSPCLLDAVTPLLDSHSILLPCGKRVQCLTQNEQLHISSVASSNSIASQFGTRLLLETSDLRSYTPGMLAVVGLCHLPNGEQQQGGAVGLPQLLAHESKKVLVQLKALGFSGKVNSAMDVNTMVQALSLVLEFRRTNIMHTTSTIQDMYLARQVLSLYCELMVDSTPEELHCRAHNSALHNGTALLRQRIRLSFLLAMIWVLQGGLDDNQRAQLEDAVRTLMGGLCMEVTEDGGYASLLPAPPERIIDYRLNHSNYQLVPWTTDDLPVSLSASVDHDGSLCALEGISTLLVATPSLASTRHFLTKLLCAGSHILLLGPGTWVLKNLAKNTVASLPQKQFVSMRTSLSSSSSPENMKLLVQENLHRCRANVLRPCIGKVPVVLVEDLHISSMARAHTRGSAEDQPPVIEWCRQLMDSGSFYDTAAGFPCNLPGLRLFATGLPHYTKDGNTEICLNKRFRHHACTLSMNSKTNREEEYFFTAQPLATMLQPAFEVTLAKSRDASKVIQPGIEGSVKGMLAAVQSLRTSVGSVMAPTAATNQLFLMDVNVLARVAQGLVQIVVGLNSAGELGRKIAGDVQEGRASQYVPVEGDDIPDDDEGAPGQTGEYKWTKPADSASPDPIRTKPKKMGTPMGMFARAWRHEIEREVLDRVGSKSSSELAQRYLEALECGVETGFPGLNGALRMHAAFGHREMFAPLGPGFLPEMVRPELVREQLTQLMRQHIGKDQAIVDAEGGPGSAQGWFGKLPHGAVTHVCQVTRLLRMQWELGHVIIVGEPASRRNTTLVLAARLLGMSTLNLKSSVAAGGAKEVMGQTSSTPALNSSLALLRHMQEEEEETKDVKERDYIMKQLRSNILNKIKYGNSHKTLYIAPDDLTSSNETLEALHQVLVSGVIPGLQDEMTTHDVFSVYQNAVNTGEPAMKVDHILEVEEQRQKTWAKIKELVKFAFIVTPERYLELQREFPALVSMCGVVVIKDPNHHELREVCEQILEPLDLWPTDKEDQEEGKERLMDHLKGISPPGRNELVQLSAEVHQTVLDAANTFEKDTGRKIPIPPVKHVEALELIKGMMHSNRNSLWKQIAELERSLEKLEKSDIRQRECEQVLETIQPLLAAKVESNSQMLVEMAEAEERSSFLKADITQEEARMDQVQAQIADVQSKADNELHAAIVLYDESMEEVMALAKDDIAELKSFNKPPGLVKIVMEAVCILHGETPGWEEAQLMLTDKNFLARMKDLDRNGVSDNTIRRLQSYVRNQNFRPEAVEQVSQAARSLCLWVLALDQYAKVRSNIAFRSGKLKEAVAKVTLTRQKLTEKKKSSEELQQHIINLRHTHNAHVNALKTIEDERKHTLAQIHKIAVLTNSFSEQRVEWQAKLVELQAAQARLVGDSLLAAACVVYLGSFNEASRTQIIQKWVVRAELLGVQVDPAFSLHKFLCYRDPFTRHIPRDVLLDDHTRDSLVLVTQSRQWPLLIDPDGEGIALLYQLRSEGYWKNTSIDDPSVEDHVCRAMESSTSVLLQLDVEKLPLSLLFRLLAIASEFANKGDSSTPRLPRGGGSTNSLNALLGRGDGGKTESKEEQAPSHSLPLGIYLYTKTTNPKLPAELVGRVNVVSFALGAEALEQRLVGQVLSFMQPKAQDTLRHLQAVQVADKRIILEVQHKLVGYIAKCPGPVWDDQKLVEALLANLSSIAATKDDLKHAQSQQKELTDQQEPFHRIAQVGCMLYAVMSELAVKSATFVVPFALYSQLFQRALEQAEMKTKSGKQRQVMKNLTEKLNGGRVEMHVTPSPEEVKILLINVTRNLYSQVCERMNRMDCATVGFHLTLRFMRVSEAVTNEELQFLYDLGTDLSDHFGILGEEPEVRSASIAALNPEKAEHDIVSEAVLKQLQKLEVLYPDHEAFIGLQHSVHRTHATAWRQCLEAKVPAESLPADWRHRLTDFQSLVMLRVLYPPKFITSVEWLVRKYLGNYHESCPAYRLLAAESLAKKQFPLVIVHTSGNEDAANNIEHAAKVAKRADQVEFVALGQRHLMELEEVLYEGMQKGVWLVLLHCETDLHWLHLLGPKLTHIDLPPGKSVHPDFCLWVCLQSSCFHEVPGALLSTAVVVALEPPRSVQSHLLRCYQAIGEKERHYEVDEMNSDVYQQHVFGLALFHSIFSAAQFNFPMRRPGRQLQPNEADFLAGVAALKEFFLPDSMKQRMELNQGSSGTDYTSLIQTLMRVANDPQIISPWDRNECEVLLNRCIGHDILTKTYIVHLVPKEQEESDEEQEQDEDPSISHRENEESQRLPWGGDLARYLHFIADVLPDDACQQGPLGFDVDFELRFVSPPESISLGTRSATKVFLESLRKDPPRSELESQLELHSNRTLKQIVIDTTLALKSTSSILSSLKSTVEASLATQNPRREDFNLTVNDIFAPLWRTELLMLVQMVDTVMEDLITMNEAMECAYLQTSYSSELAKALSTGKLPSKWSLTGSQAVTRTLLNWLREVQQRTDFLSERYEAVETLPQDNANSTQNSLVPDGLAIFPRRHNFSLYFNSRAVLLGYLRWYAQENKVDFSTVDLTIEFPQFNPHNQPLDMDGIFIDGLQVFGGQLDAQSTVISELPPEQQFSALPMMVVLPKEKAQPNQNDQVFDMPLYQAHTSNSNAPPDQTEWFISRLSVKTRKEPEFWIRRGAGIYCQVSDDC